MAKREIKEGDLNIGKMLQAARESKNILQKDIADETSLSPGHICDIECGRCKGSIHLLIGYCRKLNMSPNEILGFTDKKESNVIPELQNEIECLSPEEQKKLIKIINVMFNE